MKSYYQNCKGQVAIIVAISLIVLIGMVGLAIDSGRGYGVKAKLSAAVDAAAIAAARASAVGANDAERHDNAVLAAQKFFDGNFPSDYLGVDPTKTVLNADAVHEASGYWRVSVSATADMPTTFMRVLGQDLVTVAAKGETIRRDIDLVLVLDTTGSLGPPWSPSGTFDKVKAAAISFISKFAEGPGGDRVGLVTFATGAVVDEPINTTAARGFDKDSVTTKISALSNAGGTTAAEGLRRGYNELNAVPAALRSSLRVIVFFSDGAPNGVPATFTRSGGATVTGDIYAGPYGLDTGDPAFWNARADDAYRWDRRNTSLGTYSDIPSLPLTSGATLTLTDIGGTTPPQSIPLASYNSIRSLGGTPYTNTRCNANRAARNMLENIANTARDGATPVLEVQDVVVFSIGLGSMLNKLEVIGCSYAPAPSLPAGTCPDPGVCPECGCSIMKRVANTSDSNTRNDAQPIGRFVYAGTASELDAAFSEIASEILRLSM